MQGPTAGKGGAFEDMRQLAADIKRCQAEEKAKLAAIVRGWRLEDARHHSGGDSFVAEHGAPVATPRERRDGGTANATRAGPDDDESDEPEPHPEPPTRRLCAFCGQDIPADHSPRALYCSDAHGDRDRQRRKRQRDRERDLRPRIPTTADFRRMLEITPEDVERLRAAAACRCNGRHLEFDPGSCFRCGHQLPRGVAA